jgi:ribosome-binding factor A
MSRRQQRVEELLRREIAQMLMRGELRDPRLTPASAVGITGVEVSADLSVARVFVDVLTEALRRDDVLAALRSGGGMIRSRLGERLRMRRAPELRFEADSSITRGAAIEAILTEMREAGELGESKPAPEAEPVTVGDFDDDDDEEPFDGPA